MSGSYTYGIAALGQTVPLIHVPKYLQLHSPPNYKPVSCYSASGMLSAPPPVPTHFNNLFCHLICLTLHQHTHAIKPQQHPNDSPNDPPNTNKHLDVVKQLSVRFSFVTFFFLFFINCFFFFADTLGYIQTFRHILAQRHTRKFRKTSAQTLPSTSVLNLCFICSPKHQCADSLSHNKLDNLILYLCT